MPHARQGDIHWYDFGPVIGADTFGSPPGADHQQQRLPTVPSEWR